MFYWLPPNEIVEHKNQTLFEIAKCILQYKQLSNDSRKKLPIQQTSTYSYEKKNTTKSLDWYKTFNSISLNVWMSYLWTCFRWKAYKILFLKGKNAFIWAMLLFHWN